MSLIVVDGGSSDSTAAIARSHGAVVFVNPGQYGYGLQGARHFGENAGSAEYVWNVDSDNYVVEPTAAADLLNALQSDSKVQIAVPLVAVDPEGSSFSNWLSLEDLSNIEHMARTGRSQHDNFVVVEMTYGITNASMIRRSALHAAGGFDSDVRLLGRLQRLGLSTAAIVPTAHFYHAQATSWKSYRTKWIRRIAFYSDMTGDQLRRYFAEHPLPVSIRGTIGSSTLFRFLTAPFRSARQLMLTRDSTWGWGLVFPFILFSIVIRHPVLFLRAWVSFA